MDIIIIEEIWIIEIVMDIIIIDIIIIIEINKSKKIIKNYLLVIYHIIVNKEIFKILFKEIIYDHKIYILLEMINDNVKDMDILILMMNKQLNLLKKSLNENKYKVDE